MDGKGSNMMCKLNGQMGNGGYDMQMKGGYKRGHYDVQMKRADGKGGHYDVEMKGWMQQGAI